MDGRMFGWGWFCVSLVGFPVRVDAGQDLGGGTIIKRRSGCRPNTHPCACACVKVPSGVPVIW